MGCVVVGWLCCFPASGQIEKGGRIREAGNWNAGLVGFCPMADGRG